MTTGQQIQRARKRAGLSQKQLGEILGLSASMIGQWENDLRNPKRETLRRLAKALHVTIPYFDGMDDINALDIDEALRSGDKRTAEKLMGLPEGTLDHPPAGYCYSDMEKNLVYLFSKLTKEGQKEAVKRMEELAELTRYRRPDAPRLLNIADIDICAKPAPQSPPSPQVATDTTPPPDAPETASQPPVAPSCNEDTPTLEKPVEGPPEGE